MCVNQRLTGSAATASPPAAATATATATTAASQRRAAAETTPTSAIRGKTTASPSSSPALSPQHSATFLPPRANLARGGMPTAAPTGEHEGESSKKHAIFADAVGIRLLAVASDEDASASAQRVEDDEDESSMGQCYPKCMNQVDGVEYDGPVLPGMRAKRSSKQRTNLSGMKQNAADSSSNNSRECNDSCLEFDSIGRAMGALDLEELASEGIVNALFDQPPKSIVVDYEEAPDVEQARRSRQNSIADCARDACRPLDNEYAQQNPAEELFSGDAKSAPPTPGGRRRSRRDSVGNNNSSTTSTSTTSTSTPASSAMTPRRGKSVMLANDKVVAREPVSPLTDTDASEGDADLRCSSVPKLCLCEVKLHKTRESCWLVANLEVFDVTGILDVHPGGPRSILRKAGGPDCTQDMKFHTKNARKMLDKCFIGKLQPCGDEPERQDSNCAIM